ncbi:DUF1212-domain-containing protein [Alternaria panax]|uniref:DUF1212-domain-containing protein n=1 Tax=Alternaria panax TaxID=48097 RepID=A0AAD4NNF1_9PLEO|nr:DUF1212-domain-containing protein [Alternaria panax]
MEPSSSNSSEHTHVDAHEMQQIPPTYPSPSIQPEQATGKTRVRFNSSANVEVPPPPLEQIRSYSRVSESGSDQITTNQHTVDAEELLNAHNAGEGVHAQNSNTLPLSEVDPDGAYTATGNTNGGIFYQLLQAYKTPVRGYTDTSSEASETSPSQRPGSSSGAGTPSKRKWYNANKPMQSTETLATLIGASAKLANPKHENKDVPMRPRHHKRTSSGGIIAKVWKAKEDQDAKIKIHVANILKRQQYIIRMCRALMLFGAPTHRLEEYLATTAKVLEINSQFLYIPGCMIISFDDNLTHTAEVKIVRTVQGVNLGKLKDTHDIYKEVLHDVIGLDEALARLEDVINAKDRHPRWLTVLMYGLASAAVSCFFKARPIDMPIIFVLGIILGLLQLVIAPLSKTYSTVFEITAAILMSFLARAFGSINNGNLFCFSAIAQSAIALILPGWLVLSSALELQSRAIVPGSIRLVFAIIYSLFLGYGITVGTAIYGAIDSNATNSTQCQSPMNPYWNFLMVPLYVFFTTFTVQAKYKQMPAMIVIAFAGYIVNFYAGMKFSSSAPIAYTFGAFTIGVLANLYSRLRHGVAAAVLLPAVYVQVPGSLASSGSINSALQTASALIKGSGGAADTTTDSLNAIVFNVAASMIQIAIGITVGLFMAALLVYPMGKRRSGLWTL